MKEDNKMRSHLQLPLLPKVKSTATMLKGKIESVIEYFGFNKGYDKYLKG